MMNTRIAALRLPASFFALLITAQSAGAEPPMPEGMVGWWYRLLGEYDGAGKSMQETLYLGDLPVAVFRPGATTVVTKLSSTLGIYYAYSDHINTPRVLTRATDDKMVWSRNSADPFGLNQPDENPARLSSFTYNPRFPGQIFEKETNNHYNYFRDYDLLSVILATSGLYRIHRSAFKIVRRMRVKPEPTMARRSFTTPSRRFCGK